VVAEFKVLSPYMCGLTEATHVHIQDFNYESLEYEADKLTTWPWRSVQKFDMVAYRRQYLTKRF
jgi:hypothetical protein